MDEKPGSCNGNLPGVVYAFGSVGELVAGLNSCQASPAAGISGVTSLVAGSEREWSLPGVHVRTLQIGSYSGLNSSPYGIPSGNHIEDRPVYLVYYR